MSSRSSIREAWRANGSSRVARSPRAMRRRRKVGRNHGPPRSSCSAEARARGGCKWLTTRTGLANVAAISCANPFEEQPRHLVLVLVRHQLVQVFGDASVSSCRSPSTSRSRRATVRTVSGSAVRIARSGSRGVQGAGTASSRRGCSVSAPARATAGRGSAAAHRQPVATARVLLVGDQWRWFRTAPIWLGSCTHSRPCRNAACWR